MTMSEKPSATMERSDRLKGVMSHAASSRLAKLLMAASLLPAALVGSAPAVATTARTGTVSPAKRRQNELNLRRREASVKIDAKYQADNVFDSCSATRIGPSTLLMAKHCISTNAMLDKPISTPFNALTANLGLPAYEVVNRQGRVAQAVVSSIVEDPTGRDMATVGVTNPSDLKGIPQLRVATEADQQKLKTGDIFQVSGYPTELGGDTEISFNVELLGQFTDNSVDNKYASPLEPQHFLAFAIPASFHNQNADYFCQGGGMSGAGFTKYDTVYADLSSDITLGQDPTDWERLNQRFGTGLQGVDSVCLGVPVTQGLIQEYEKAETFVPPQLLIPQA